MNATWQVGGDLCVRANLGDVLFAKCFVCVALYYGFWEPLFDEQSFGSPKESAPLKFQCPAYGRQTPRL